MDESEQAQMAQLTQELNAIKAAHSALTTAHTSLTTEHETSKANFSTIQSELKTANDVNKSSTKSLEDLQKQIGERDTTIATHVEAMTAYETLKTEHGTLVEANLVSIKERLKLAGIGDELIEGKSTTELSIMESTVAALPKSIPQGTQQNPSSNGLTSTGDQNVPATLAGLETEINEITAAKKRAGING